MAPKQDDSQFIVHLQGISLPPDTAAQVAREVQSAALRELARLDLRGDLTFRIPRKEWLGIWIERVQAIDLPVPRAPGR
jgi:hypothetical protein